MSENNRSADVLVAFGVGLLVGAAGALLLAPTSGEEARRKLGELSNQALDRTKGGMDTAKGFMKDQAERVERAFEEGKDAYKRETART
jgi:gas vesicle protein